MTPTSERGDVGRPREGYVRNPVIIGFIGVVVLVAVLAQAQDSDKDKHDHRIFPCMEDGLSSSDTGCQLLAKMKISQVPEGPLFWHLNRFLAKKGAEAARRNSLVAQAEGQSWLFSFGPKGAAPKQGEYVATIGPLPLTSAKLPPAKSYEVVAYLAIMPPGMYTRVHMATLVPACPLMTTSSTPKPPAAHRRQPQRLLRLRLRRRRQ